MRLDSGKHCRTSIKIPSDACLVPCDQASVHRRREGSDFPEQV